MKSIARILLVSILLLPLTAATTGPVRLDKYQGMSEKDLYSHGKDCRDRDIPDSALLYYTLLLHRHSGRGRHDDATGNLRAAQACIDMGNIYANTYHEYDKAYSSFHRAEEIARKHGLETELAECFTDLGVIYYMQDLVENSNNFTDTIFSLYKQGFRYAMDSGDKKGVLHATLNMALSAMDLKREKSIENEIAEFMHWSEDAKDRETSFVRVVCGLAGGIASSDEKRIAEATRRLKETSRGISYYTLVYHDMMSDLNLHSGKPAEALAHLDSCTMVEGFRPDEKWLTMQIARRKSECLEMLGDRQGADAQMLTYYKDRDSLLNRGKVRNVKSLHFLNEIDEINADMDKMAMQRERDRRWLAIVSTVALALVAILTLLLVTYRRLRHSHAKLFDQSKLLLEAESMGQQSTAAERAISNHGSDDEEEAEQEDTAIANEGRDSDSEPARPQGLNLTEEQKDDLLGKIKSCLAKEDLICGTSFQIKTLADEVGLRPRVASQAINELFGCSFTTLLGEARIKCVCRRILHSKDYRKLTIETIAEGSGFKSRSHFTMIFKKFTGLTPSEYIRQANNQQPG